MTDSKENPLVKYTKKRFQESEEAARQAILDRHAQRKDDPEIRIRRQWDDWQIGSIRLSQLSNLHWSDYSGGIWQRAPHFFIHGYCWCTDVEGEISHSCQHGPPPHWIRVCVVKKDNEREVCDLLLAIVGPKPKKEG